MATTTSPLLDLTTNLFGLPYQFTDAVDPRVNGISTILGKKFAENIMLEAPICTIIPGEPIYLPGQSNATRYSTSRVLLENSDGGGSLRNWIKNHTSDDNDFRLYDFKNSYNEYIKYVNVLCRTGAVYLDLDQTINGATTFQNFDWRYYKLNKNSGLSIKSRYDRLKENINNKINFGSLNNFAYDSGSGSGDDSLESIMKNYNYVQFYVDADISSGDTMSNEVGTSALKSMMDTGSSTMKELAFLTKSGGVDTSTLTTFVADSTVAFQSGVSDILGSNRITGAISRIINLGGDVLKGHNIVIPDVYQNSSYSKSYNITVHLKTPYGTKYGYYMDIFVPMMHLLALTMPRQESANSFSSPFLVKAYVPGIFSCNLGIVTQISISRSSESWSAQGLPSEVDISLDIVDLYSSLYMSPSSSPVMFINNSSLIEYIANSCGLDLTSPNLSKKVQNMVTTMENALTDIPATITGSVKEQIYAKINNFLSIY